MPRGEVCTSATSPQQISAYAEMSLQGPDSAQHEPHVDRPQRVLVIVAHPDDADFGVAGTIAAWVRAGSVARLVCCTSGDAGGDDPATDPLALARQREEEQRAAAAVVG